jgi:hypothetical protein
MKIFSRALTIAALAGVAVMSAAFTTSASAASGTATTNVVLDNDCCNN